MRHVLLLIAFFGPVALATSATSQPSDEMVLTPGGYRARALIHHIERGQVVREQLGQYEILDVSRRVVKIIPKMPGKSRSVHADGWVTYSSWSKTTTAPISSFRSTWQVPEVPSSHSGQILYYFNGLEPDGKDAILQPVLQWGSTPAGGGDYWGVASWYVTSDGQAMHTDVVPINSGVSLVGVMNLISSDRSFSYTSEFLGVAGTLLSVENVAELTWASETLETYQTSSCSDYSSSATAFTSIAIEAGPSSIPSIDWEVTNSVTDCGQHTSIVNKSSTDGEVDIYTQSRSLE